MLPKPHIQTGQSQLRQSPGNIAHQAHTPGIKLELPGHQGGGQNRQNGSGFGQDIRPSRRQPHSHQKRLQALACQHQKQQRADANGQGRRIGIADRPDQGLANRQQVVAGGLNPENMLELAGRNDNTGGGNKAGNDRVTEEIGEEAKPENTH